MKPIQHVKRPFKIVSMLQREAGKTYTFWASKFDELPEKDDVVEIVTIDGSGKSFVGKVVSVDKKERDFRVLFVSEK